MSAKKVEFCDAIESIEPGFACGDNLASGLAQLRMNNISREGIFDWSDIRRVPVEHKKLARFSLSNGDIAFNCTNSPELVGKAALFRRFREPLLFSNHFLRIRVRRDLFEPGFVAYWLQSSWRRGELQRLAVRWVNQATIRKEDLLQMRLPSPELADQRAITAALDSISALRHNRRYHLQLCDEFLPAVFLKAFGDPKTNPKRYPLVPAGELFDPIRGVKCGPFGSALKKHEYVAAGVPVWTMENVQANNFIEHGCAYITPEKYQELTAYDARNGDILISRAGTVGRMAVVRTRADKSIIHSNLIRLSLNRERLAPEYFVILMTYFGRRVARLKTGQEEAYTFMNTGTLEELPIPLPPVPEQKKFLELLRQHEAFRATQVEALRQADHLFQSLLHRAFNGAH